MNWTTKCKVVTKSGNGKPKWSGENIHLLYMESKMEKKNLAYRIQQPTRRATAETHQAPMNTPLMSAFRHQSLFFSDLVAKWAT